MHRHLPPDPAPAAVPAEDRPPPASSDPTPMGAGPEDRYVVSRELARGGMGRVLLAHDRKLDREVAIKEQLDHRGTASARFLREALTTARLQHPAITSVYDIDRRPSGEPYLVMRRVPGRPLKELIEAAATVDDRMRLLPYVLAACDAVAYAHGQRIIHRDLKPANILVGDFGETVVIDWGLAKDLSATPPTSEPLEGLTAEGAILGTPTHMAPEQAEGEPADERTDVYSLGAVLYHVITGVPPVSGETVHQIMGQLLVGRVRSIEERVPAAPRDLATLVRKAMAFKPTERFSTARELAVELRDLLAGRLIASHAYTTRELVARWARRHAAILCVAAISAALLVGLGAASVRRIVSEREVARAAQRTAEHARVDAERRGQELILERAQSLVERDPTEAIRTLATLSPDLPGWSEARWLALAARARSPASLVLRIPELLALRMSEDGRTLISLSEDRLVRSWDLTDGSERSRHQLPQQAMSLYSREIDMKGERVAYWGPDRSLHVADLNTHADRLLTAEKDGARIRFTGLRDQLLLSGKEGLRLLDLTSGTTLGLLSGFHYGARYGGEALFDDSRHLIVPVDDTHLQCWSLRDGSTRILTRPARGEYAVQDGGTLVAIVDDKTSIRLVDVADGSARRIPLPPVDVRAISISPDGTQFALFDGGSSVEILDVDGRGRHRLTGPALAVFGGGRFSRDGKRLAGWTKGGTTNISWDLATGRWWEFGHHAGARVENFEWSNDGATAAIAYGDSEIRVWRMLTPIVDQVVLGDLPAGWLMLDLSPDARHAVVGGVGGDLLWDVDARSSRVLYSHRMERSVFSPDSRLRGSIDSNGAAWIWPVLSGSGKRIGDHSARYVDFAFSRDSLRIAAASETGEITIVDLETGISRHRAAVRPKELSELDYCGKSRVGAVTKDGRVRLFDVAGGSEIVFQGIPDQPPTGWACSEDGKWIAYGKDDVHLVDMTTGKERILEGHLRSSGSLVFSADSSRLMIVSAEGTIWNLNLNSGLLKVMHGASGDILEASLAPDGQALFAWSASGEARLWLVATGRSLRWSMGSERSTAYAGFSRDGEWLFQCSFEGSGEVLRRWRLDLPGNPTALHQYLLSAVRTLPPPGDQGRGP